MINRKITFTRTIGKMTNWEQTTGGLISRGIAGKMLDLGRKVSDLEKKARRLWWTDFCWVPVHPLPDAWLTIVCSKNSRSPRSRVTVEHEILLSTYRTFESTLTFTGPLMR